MAELILSQRFQRQARKLVKHNPSLKQKISQILKILVDDPRSAKLRLHKLSGSDNWSVSVTSDIRIILNWEEEQLYLTGIGSHDEVY